MLYNFQSVIFSLISRFSFLSFWSLLTYPLCVHAYFNYLSSVFCFLYSKCHFLFSSYSIHLFASCSHSSLCPHLCCLTELIHLLWVSFPSASNSSIVPEHLTFLLLQPTYHGLCVPPGVGQFCQVFYRIDQTLVLAASSGL